MRLHRFIGQFDFSQSLTSLADPRTVRRIIKVFRLAEGDSVILSDGNGRECIAEIKKIEGKKIYLLIRKENGSVNRAPGGITLYCAILKREHFKLMVQKTTEIGIAEITPMITDRTVKKALNLGRLQDIARESTEQSGQQFVPNIREPVPFEEAIKEARNKKTVLFFDQTGGQFEKRTVAHTKDIALFIGPEGGWSDAERAVAAAHGWHIVRLFPMALRADTTAIIASFLASNSQTSPHPVE